MTWFEVAIVILYTLSAALPLTGLFGLYRAARERFKRLSRGAEPKRFDRDNWQMNDFMDVLADDINSPARVLSDFVMIGGGIIAGAAAGIMSMFL